MYTFTLTFISLPAMIPMLLLETLGIHCSLGVQPMGNIFNFLLNPLLICRTVLQAMVSQAPTSVDPVNAILSMPT